MIIAILVSEKYYSTEFLICNSPMTKNVTPLFMCYWPSYISFRDMSIQILYPFLNWVVFYYLAVNMLYISRYKSHVSYKICKSFLPICVLSFCFLDWYISFETQKYIISMNIYNIHFQLIRLFSYLTWVLRLFEERIMINAKMLIFTARGYAFCPQSTGALHMTLIL